MARVVDPKPQPEIEKTISCGGCGAKIAYVPNDVKKYVGRDISGGPDGCKWVVCPNCSHKIIIERW